MVTESPKGEPAGVRRVLSLCSRACLTGGALQIGSSQQTASWERTPSRQGWCPPARIRPRSLDRDVPRRKCPAGTLGKATSPGKGMMGEGRGQRVGVAWTDGATHRSPSCQSDIRPVRRGPALLATSLRIQPVRLAESSGSSPPVISFPY